LIAGSEIEEKLKNDTGHGLTCFASQKGSKRDLIVGKVKRVDTKIIRKIYKDVKTATYLTSLLAVYFSKYLNPKENRCNIHHYLWDQLTRRCRDSTHNIFLLKIDKNYLN
jgi:hypothetical protein